MHEIPAVAGFPLLKINSWGETIVLNWRLVVVLVTLLIAACQVKKPEADAATGEHVFNASCAGCHDAPELTRAIPKAAMEVMQANDIFVSLERGPMSFQGLLIRREQRIAVAEYLGKGKVALDEIDRKLLPPAGYCKGETAPLRFQGRETGWNGWGADLENSRSRSTAAAGISAANVGRLKLKWAFAFPEANTAMAHPAYMDGRIFIGSSTGVVYALDASSGCIHWTYTDPATVRTAMTIGQITRDGKTRTALFFGDFRARVTALDADTGELLWHKTIEEHLQARITGSPVFYQGRVYVPMSSFEEMSAMNPRYQCCTFRGSITALDGASGRQVWKSYLVRKPPALTGKNRLGVAQLGPSGVPVWSAPTVDTRRGLLYVGTGGNYSPPDSGTSDAVIALDISTGAIRWVRQLTTGDVFNTSCAGTPDKINCPDNPGDDLDFGSSPVLRTLVNGRDIIVAGQKSGVVHALDPDRNGAVLWQTRISEGGSAGGIQWGMAAGGDTVYAANSALNFPIQTNAGGGLFAINLATGEQRWAIKPPVPDCQGAPAGCGQGQMAAVTLVPGVVFSGSLDGHLRAYATADGSILWDFATARAFPTVNGVAGHGGSLSGPGAAVANGMLFVNSGYYNAMNGNVLLAFKVE